MQKLASVWMVGISLIAFSALPAQDPPEKERIVCDVNDPKSKCPGANCLCTDDTFEITFDGGTDSVFEYYRFLADTPIHTAVICDAKSTRPNPSPPPDVLGAIQGWSFGVDHDDAFLTLTAVTIVGTETERFGETAFVVTDMVDIETCLNDPDPKCPNPEPGTGYIHAVLPQFLGNLRVLEPRRSLILKADYTLKADPGRQGTLIQFVSHLKKRRSPPVDINLIVGGMSRLVTKVVDGWVKAESHGDVGTPEDLATPGSCTDGADNDFDSKIDADDEGCHAECRDHAFYFGPGALSATLPVEDWASYVVSMQNMDASLGFQLGVKAATVAGTTTWEFSGALGANANRIIELLITDDNGGLKTPEAGNKAESFKDTVLGIERGAAIAGFSDDDFFEVDLAPAVGGPGFTVGYVTDLTPTVGAGNKIPPTGANPCTVNEILKVNLGGAPPRFSRGDADGDSNINVTDAILILHHLFGGIPKQFACDDIIDTNDDGSLTFSDALPVLAYMFRSGPGLPAPFKTCGTDTTNDALPCTQSSCP